MPDTPTRPWCLVLGASSGIGRGCALRLADQGMNVLGVHFDPAERLTELDDLLARIRQSGAEAKFFNENAASESCRKTIIGEMAETLREAGGVRVLIHSLAFGTLLPFIRRSPGQEVIVRRQMEMTLSVMAHSLVYWVQELFDGGLLLPGAKVFALTSAGSVRASQNYGAVSAAKCAIESHVRQLALELAPDGIAVNAIRAGVTNTPSLARIPEHEELIARAMRYNPHGRLTTPDDVGDAIGTMLATSSWLTGNIIGVDGGEILTT